MAALSLAGLNRAEYLAGAWDSAVVASERAISLAVESEDRWVIALAHWSASDVPSARGDWPVAEAHVRAIQEQSPTFERHIAAEAIATAGLAAAQDRPRDVLRALEPLERIQRATAWTTPRSSPGSISRRTRSSTPASRMRPSGSSLRRAPSPPLGRTRCSRRGWLTRGAGSTSPRHDVASAVASLEDAWARVEPLGMPFEQALIELSQGQVLRRSGERRAAAAALLAAQRRLGELDARPALQRCEAELSACGLAPAARKTRDYTALTPRELAVTRLVVSGMTNREVGEELMLSTKTVEFHLGHVYTKLGVRTRSELRARARANELSL